MNEEKLLQEIVAIREDVTAIRGSAAKKEDLGSLQGDLDIVHKDLGSLRSVVATHDDVHRIADVLSDHEDRLVRIEETMATKDDMRRMTDILESIATAVKMIQEDHVFAIEWMKRLQTQADRQEDEIRQIKLRLQMV